MRARGVLILLLAVSVGSAQTELWQQTGVPGAQRLGGLTTFFLDGDLDGDGYEDFAVSGEGYQLPVLFIQSRIYFMSGRDGSVIRYYGSAPDPRFFRIADAGHVDRDGIRDYVVAIHPPSSNAMRLEVRSGRTDALLWQVLEPQGFTNQFGDYLAGGLDTDGDGCSDLVVGASREPPNGQVHVYSSTGQRRYSVATPHWGLGVLGDLDRDGCDDFIIGGTNRLVTNAGWGRVYSGRTGAFLVEGTGDLLDDGIGSGKNAGCGDVNGDGVLDFVCTSRASLVLNGMVRVFSGADGTPLFTWRRPLTTGFGISLAVGDLDLDGMPDLLVGSNEPIQNTGGRVYWLSLRDGSIVTQLFPPGLPGATTRFGFSVAIGGPQPGSPFPVFTSNGQDYKPPFTPTNPLSATGRVTLYSGAPPGVSSTGPGCAGRTPSAPVMGITAPSSGLARLHLSAAPPSTPSALLLGLSSTSWSGVPLPLPLATLGLPSCSLRTSIEAVVPVAVDATGYGAFVLPLPLVAVGGTPIFGQWLLALQGNPIQPAALSGALSWRH